MKSGISGQYRNLVPIPKQGWYRYPYTEPKWYRYQEKVVLVPSQSGTGTHLQNMVGTGTDQSGTVPMLLAALIFVFVH